MTATQRHRFDSQLLASEVNDDDVAIQFINYFYFPSGSRTECPAMTDSTPPPGSKFGVKLRKVSSSVVELAKIEDQRSSSPAVNNRRSAPVSCRIASRQASAERQAIERRKLTDRRSVNRITSSQSDNRLGERKTRSLDKVTRPTIPPKPVKSNSLGKTKVPSIYKPITGGRKVTPACPENSADTTDCNTTDDTGLYSTVQEYIPTIKDVLRTIGLTVYEHGEL